MFCWLLLLAIHQYEKGKVKMKNFEYEIVKLPAYRAAGFKWEGSYTEVNTLKEVIKSARNRVNELDGAVNPNIQLGLSYHLRPDGFVHYSVFEITEEQQIPDGMIEIYVPEMTYVKAHHKKGEDVGRTYANILHWLKESAYVPYVETNVKYYDELPIKHERYPSDQDMNDPHFDIFIPVVSKS